MTDILTLDELFKMEMDQLIKEHGRVPDPDSWRWSPFDIRKFDTMLCIAYNHFRNVDLHSHGPISFGEAGSGIGTKLYLAKNKYNMMEYGYEINTDYIAKAKRLNVMCEWRDLSVIDDQPIWSAFDIVYTARPFKDDIKERVWEEYVQKHMRPGAVLISTFTARKPYGWTVLYRATFRGVWLKPDMPSPEPESVQSAVTKTLPSAGKPPPGIARRTSRAGKRSLSRQGKGTICPFARQYSSVR
jgi:hypothetical protein